MPSVYIADIDSQLLDSASRSVQVRWSLAWQEVTASSTVELHFVLEK